MTTITTLPVLADGSTGPDVKWAQYLLVLKTLDYTDVDGIFGPKTDNAVRVFQGFSGLTVDGKVGPADLGRTARRQTAAADARRGLPRGGGEQSAERR